MKFDDISIGNAARHGLRPGAGPGGRHGHARRGRTAAAGQGRQAARIPGPAFADHGAVEGSHREQPGARAGHRTFRLPGRRAGRLRHADEGHQRRHHGAAVDTRNRPGRGCRTQPVHGHRRAPGGLRGRSSGGRQTVRRRQAGRRPRHGGTDHGASRAGLYRGHGRAAGTLRGNAPNWPRPISTANLRRVCSCCWASRWP